MAGYQKKSSKNARLIALGFAAFILIYLFGQLWGFANLKLRTEQVDEDTIYDFVRAQGTVFRSEQLIEPVSASGVMVYNCADGDEVAMSEEVAAVYSDSTVSTVNNQLEQLQHELDSLTKAQTAKATRYTAVSNLSSEINDQAGKIVDFVQDGVVEGISDQKDELVSLLNRKKIALGQEESFEGRITELNAQISYLEQVKDQQRGVSVESPAAGYFCKEVDGYEEVFTAEALEDITYEGYQQLVSSQPQTVSGAVGKIVTTHVWYLGVDLDNTQAQKFELGDSVRLDFKFANGQTVTGEVVQIIPDNERSNTVVIFECKDVSDRMLKLRQQSVDIIFTTYSGLRVSSDALRYEQNVPGVYVLDKTTIRFKPVEIIKDNGNFLLCEPRTGTDDAHTLSRLDLVILESGGTELKDGALLDEDTVKGVESSNAGT